ncbi:hypothetical protein [Paraburkholderia adhaesiva]|uniref:hypothetical protein n=1 Tax=Paraburkholderia adhaesiva TaxID=2883244 RepID=UPI001F205D4B|nr:hypothetical protein [Paraburkholderia adhaesiva]
MLALKRHTVKIAHLNLRTEKHGDKDVNALDIKITFDVPNGRLDDLAGGLRASLYEQSGKPDLLGPDKNHLTHLRFPQLGKVKWGGAWSPVGFHLHVGNGRGKGDLLFVQSKFDQVELTPKEGGTCTCVARAQVLPTPDETARLVGLLGHEVPASTDFTNAVGSDETGDD